MSESENADVFDCSVGTVKSQLSRARSRLGAGMATEEVPMNDFDCRLADALKRVSEHHQGTQASATFVGRRL